jgi:hypothetical protein
VASVTVIVNTAAAVGRAVEVKALSAMAVHVAAPIAHSVIVAVRRHRLNV